MPGTQQVLSRGGEHGIGGFKRGANHVNKVDERWQLWLSSTWCCGTELGGTHLSQRAQEVFSWCHSVDKLTTHYSQGACPHWGCPLFFIWTQPGDQGHRLKDTGSLYLPSRYAALKWLLVIWGPHYDLVIKCPLKALMLKTQLSSSAETTSKNKLQAFPLSD